MPIDQKLLERARQCPGTLAFDEALRLCRQLGFAKVRQVRGHRVFRRQDLLRPLNIQQGSNGRAKAYQVERMLDLDAAGGMTLAARLGPDPAAYTYQVSWSEPDGECVATCDQIRGLSGLGPTPERAIGQLKVALGAWLDYLGSRGLLTSARGR
jgi:predicted RNase H-like HicB family nuclease